MSATEPVCESAVIEALGPLFKITEIFLWDDAMVSTAPEASVHLDSLGEEPTPSCNTAHINSSINQTIDDYTSLEDFELAKQMDALGLPISFSTTKQKNIVAVKGKRKGIRSKSVSSNKDIENRVHGASKSCILEDSSRVLHDSTNMPLCDKTAEDDVGAAYDVYENRGRGVIQLDSDSLSVPAILFGDIVEEQVGNDETDAIVRKCVEDGLSPCCSDMESSALLEHLVSSDPENFPRNDMEGIKLRAYKSGELFHNNVLNNHVEGSSLSPNITVETNDDDSIKTLNLYPTSMESSLTCGSPDHHVPDYLENFICCELGDWRVIWDPFYNRNYFYNIQSQESTWYPPPGLEHFTLCSSISNSNELSTNAAEGHADINFACDCIHNIDFHRSHDRTSLFQEREDNFEHLNHSSAEVISSRTSDDIPANFTPACSDGHEIVEKISNEQVSLHTSMDHSTELTLQGEDDTLPASVVKYWLQRYLLFSQFDNGIKMDEEGWFSVTPESIARHHASRCGSGIIIDCFTGVGGNAIQFAMKNNHVIAVDIDPQKIDYAQHNAAIYGVSDQINFIVGDFFQIAPRLKGDVIFMSPPWGGPDYSKVEAYDIRTMLKPHNGQYLFEIARKIASKVVMFLPRNVDLNQLAELSLSVNPPWMLEVEKNFLNGRLKAITAYFENPML